MPKMNVPNKVCKHCGGTVWYVCYKNDGTPNYNCYVRRLETIKIWRTTTEAGKLYKAASRKLPSHKAAMKKYFKQPEILAKKNAIAKRATEKSKLELGDAYVKCRIKGDAKGALKGIDIPPELIELKRKQLLLTRKIKSNGKN